MAKKAAKPKTDPKDYSRLMQNTAALLKQISDPTRLQIIQMLAENEENVGAICEPLGMTQPAVSHHLALLRHGGIVAPRRVGKNNFYGLTEKGLELAKVVKAVTG